MAKKKGEKYNCKEYGLVVLIENPCECDEICELVCCEQPMKPVKAAKKATHKAPVKAPAKPKK